MSPAHKEALRKYDGTTEQCARKDTCNRYDKRMGKWQHKHILSMSCTTYNISSRMKKKMLTASLAGRVRGYQPGAGGRMKETKQDMSWSEARHHFWAEARGFWSPDVYTFSAEMASSVHQCKLKKKKTSSGLWLTLSLIKRGNNSYAVVRHSPPHGGMENSIVLNVLWDKLWVCGVVGGSLTLNEKKQQDGDR